MSNRYKDTEFNKTYTDNEKFEKLVNYNQKDKENE